jgi:hypothetical protein
LIQNNSENDSAMGMVMGSGWRVVPIILKMFCYFLGFLRFLICRVLFFAECPKKVLGKKTFADKMFAECRVR